MLMTDPRIDAYIEKAEPFAQPILNHLRELVHKTVPEVTETIKWGMPAFDYKGAFCGMASFKNHATFGFWKHVLLQKIDTDNVLERDSAMGSLGRITSIKDLPKDAAIISFIKEAKRLNDENIKLPPKAKKTELSELIVPTELLSALLENKEAKLTFDTFSPSNKREYIDWITEAKSEATKQRRLETAIEWMGEGKIRNWKYLRK
ncbi:MAG: YdeI/OmpD-associated family protein [Bacteroidetes bacterium]|nr:YdeI/OmpD-associated family protein [Bacteroidota bacterium]